MVCNHKTTVALLVVMVASLSAFSASSASDEDEVLTSLLRSNPKAAAAVAAAAAAAAAAAMAEADSGTPTAALSGPGTGSMAVWEAAQPDPRWYLITEAEALQDSALARRRERQAASAGSGSGSGSGHRPGTSATSVTALDANSEEERRRAGEHKRSGPSLSIVNPLEVLRQRVLLEIARRRYKQSEGQIQANRDLLRVIGKRGRSDALASNALIPSLETASDTDLMEADAAIDILSATRPVPSWWQ